MKVRLRRFRQSRERKSMSGGLQWQAGGLQREDPFNPMKRRCGGKWDSWLAGTTPKEGEEETYREQVIWNEWSNNSLMVRLMVKWLWRSLVHLEGEKHHQVLMDSGWRPCLNSNRVGTSVCSCSFSSWNCWDPCSSRLHQVNSHHISMMSEYFQWGTLKLFKQIPVTIQDDWHVRRTGLFENISVLPRRLLSFVD